MEALLRRIVRTLAGWPVVGRLVRILVALIRLPEHTDRQPRFATEQLPALLAELRTRLERLERQLGQ